VEPNWSDPDDAPAREEPRPASAPRKPQVSPEHTDDEPKGLASSARTRGKPFSASGRLSGLLLMLALAGLVGAGYLAVDFFLSQSKITVTQGQMARPSAPETTSSIARITPADRDTVAASPDERLVSYDGAKPSDMPGTLPEGLGTTDLGVAASGGNPVAQFEVASSPRAAVSPRAIPRHLPGSSARPCTASRPRSFASPTCSIAGPARPST
jgi:hypothetical protein